MLLMLDSEMIPTLHFRQEYWPSLLQDAPVEVNKNNHVAKVYSSSPQFEQEAETLTQGITCGHVYHLQLPQLSRTRM